MSQTFNEAQVQALGIVQQVEHSVLGSVPVARGPIWIGGSATPVRRAAPTLGEHTMEILSECGYSSDAIKSLLAEGVVSAAAGDQEGAVAAQIP